MNISRLGALPVLFGLICMTFSVAGSSEGQTEAFEPSWFLVRLAAPLVDANADGSFPLSTGIPELDSLIREAGIHRIDRALTVSARDPKDPAAFRRWGFDRTYRFHVAAGSEVSALVDRFVGLAGVEYAELDFLLERGAVIPNDAMWDDQWNLQNVDAPAAWETTIGSEVVIAVLDSGADSDHEDLLGKILPGWNFENDTPDTEDYFPGGHGTGVASVALANTDNNAGIAGACWNCMLMPIKVGVLSSRFADAMVWATDHGARVLNMSAGATSGSNTLLNGVGYAYDAGVLQTFIAGNGDGPVQFPAACVETIAVGGSDANDHRSAPMCGIPDTGSHTGPELDVIAPAEYIPRVNNTGGYEPSCGTSFAAPLVAGLLGLMESIHPSIGREEARHLIRAGAEDEVGDPAEDTPGFDIYHGWGRVNMDRTLGGTEASTTLRVEGKAATRVYFETANPLADSYDFVRGGLSSLSESSAGVDLGLLTCLEDDSPDADTLGNEDTGTPAPGEGFFYLARFNAPPGAGSYGGSSRNRDRMVFTQATDAAWITEGEQSGAHLGGGSGAGDVNGDGFDDVVVAALDHDGVVNQGGRVYVYHGSSAGLSKTPGWIIDGDQADCRLGWDVAGAGDVDNDGYDDVLVSSRTYDAGETNEGRVFLYHGSASGLEVTPRWTVDGNQTSALLGHSVSGAGDVNGDGYDDVVVSAPRYDDGQTDEGRVFLYLGSSGGLESSPSWTHDGDQDGAWFGSGLSSAGDVNGDGYDDVVIGAYNYDGGQTDEGRVFVFYGSSSGLSATPDVIIEEDQLGARFGCHVASAGDVNGDGYDDMLAGALAYPSAGGAGGAAFLYLGSASGVDPAHDWAFESDQDGAGVGYQVAGAGDVDGDGYDDVIVSANKYAVLRSEEGRVFLFKGSASGLSSSYAWSISGMQAGAHMGGSLAGAGNVNGDVDAEGDPLHDVIIGAGRHDNGEFDEGRAYVYHGPLTEAPAVDCSK